MKDERDKGFRIINKFSNFFDKTCPCFVYLPCTECQSFRKECEELKTELLKNEQHEEIRSTKILYRAREALEKDMAYNSDDILEVEFWKAYIISYFNVNDNKDFTGRKKFINEWCVYARMSEWKEICEALSNGYLGYNKDKSGAPPMEVCENGRANKDGQSVLYLGESINTCLLECNANRGENFSIGEFQAREKLIVYDFIASEDDCNQLWLSSIFSQVTQQGNYAKTQTLARLIKELGYDGIKYRSAKEEEGVCYVIFYPEKFECTRSFLVQPTNVTISFRK